MRRLLTLLLIFAPALLLAQGKVHLEFESGGPRIGWVADQVTAPPDNAAKWDGKSFDLDTSTSDSGSIVQILDTSTGNLASKKLSAIKNGWLVKSTDFNLIGEVKVRVEHDGQPVEVADVHSSDGVRSASFLIDSSSKGVAEFYGVKPGNFSVSIDYHSGTANKTQKQSFSVELQRDSAIPLLVVSITNDVATLSETGTAGGLNQPLTPPTSLNNGQPIYTGSKSTKAGQTLGTVALYILALFIAVLFIYVGFTWLQRNQDKAQTALNRFGVSLNNPDPLDPAINGPLKPVQPQPVQQILLGDASPTPLVPVPAPTAVYSAAPHFTRETGEVINVPEGTSAVGRDAGLPISLVGEASVSRHHAEVVRNGSSVVVRDLGSTNGTFVNGAKVDGEAAVKPGDTIQFGTVRMRYEA